MLGEHLCSPCLAADGSAAAGALLLALPDVAVACLTLQMQPLAELLPAVVSRLSRSSEPELCAAAWHLAAAGAAALPCHAELYLVAH